MDRRNEETIQASSGKEHWGFGSVIITRRTEHQTLHFPLSFRDLDTTVLSQTITPHRLHHGRRRQIQS